MPTDQQWLDLALAHQRAGRVVEAEHIYRQLAAAYPGHPALQHELGVLAFQAGRPAEARSFLAQAVALDPQRAEYRNNLGLLLQELGELDAAAASYEAAIQLQPGLSTAHYNLGNLRSRQQQWDAAITHFRQSLTLQPSHADSHLELALAMASRGQVDPAMEVLRAAVARFPHDSRFWNNLGNLHFRSHDFDPAEAAFRRALQGSPNSATFHNNLGGALRELGRIDEAIACYRAGLALDPALAELRSGLILTLHLDPAVTPSIIAAECQQWQEQHALPLRAWERPFTNPRDPDRPLRIGYVSPDFRDHPVGRQLLPLLRAHDRQHFQIVCYSDASPTDALTERFRAIGGEWHNSATWNDEQLAEQIHGHQIDILVDLALHTAANRLRVFARRPAPIQVSFAGYPGSTGLDAIDYRLTDRFLDSRDSPTPHATDRAIPLADSFWCFNPLEDTPPVNPLPARDAGYVVFGCLHKFCKVNASVLSLWCRVLHGVPGSRLRLLCPSGEARDRVVRILAQSGIAADRLEFVAFQPRRDFLAEHHRIDVILDTFPYNGHVTVCDALWMGLPVVSLLGALPVTRGGWSILSNVGLSELGTSSEDEYVRIAVGLARDLPRLAELRAGLRARMQASPLMNSERFARSVEAAFRQMWQRWSDR